MTGRTIGSQVGADPTWSYVRDAFGRLRQVVHPTGTPVEQTDLTRDESGNITEVKRDGNVTDTVTRDANDRVTSVVRTCQDGFASDYSVEYDLAGEVKSVSSQVGQNAQQEPVRLKHQYGYNSSTDLSTVSLHRKDGTGAWAPALLELDYTYDDYNRLERIEVSPLSAAVRFHRDQAGRVDRIDHEAAGQIRNRVRVAYADNTSWLASLTMGAPDEENVADPPLLRLVYVYDGAGRIVRIDETGLAGPDATRIFTYDDASHLKKAEDHHGFPDEDKFVWEYNYNTAGEREWKKVDGALEDYLWDGLGMLDQVTGETTKDFAFDNAGNLTSVTQGSDTLQFGYDKSGRVSSVEDASTTLNYRYGPDERRVARSVNGTTTRYFTDGLVTYELDGATTEIQRAYVFLPDGYTPIMLVRFDNGVPTELYFYLNDHLSTPRIVTDDMGASVWRARYAPFGEVIERCDTNQDGVWNDPCPLSQPIRFPGQWDDGIEGVWYNWHRFYLPEYGLYARVDPVFQVGARVWDYVGGNPVSSIDPLGLINGPGYGSAEYWKKRAENFEEHHDSYVDASQFIAEQVAWGIVGGLAFKAGLWALRSVRAAIPALWGAAEWGAAAEATAVTGGAMAGSCVGGVSRGLTAEASGWGASASKKFTPDQSAVIQLAKEAKKGGAIAPEDAQLLLDWAGEYGVKAMDHTASPWHWLGPHIHIGKQSHIRVK